MQIERKANPGIWTEHRERVLPVVLQAGIGEKYQAGKGHLVEQQRKVPRRNYPSP